MTKPDAILHLGFNKCGTTALQDWLGDHVDDLREHGIWYRRMDPRPDVTCTNPHLLVLAFTLADQPVFPRPMNDVLDIPEGDRARQDKVAEDFRKAFEAEVAKGGFDTWVGSSEALVSTRMTKEAISALAGWLSSLFGRVRYVAYVRRPENWMISVFGHHKRLSGTDETLSDFIDRTKGVPYMWLLRMWEAAVGRDALDVRLFHEDWLSGTGLVEDFSTVLGLPTGAIDARARRLNTSYRRTPLSRAPRRPVLSAEDRATIRDRNSHILDWLEHTYFPDRRAEFRTWAAG